MMHDAYDRHSSTSWAQKPFSLSNLSSRLSAKEITVTDALVQRMMGQNAEEQDPANLSVVRQFVSSLQVFTGYKECLIRLVALRWCYARFHLAESVGEVSDFRLNVLAVVYEKLTC